MSNDWIKVVSKKNKKKVRFEDGIMAVSGESDGWETIRVEGLMDSGAIDTIGPKELLGSEGTKDTKMLGTKYYDAKGGTITNIGGMKIKGKSDDGIPISLKAQVGDSVRRLLIAINQVVAGGNMVVFGAKRDTLRKLAEAKTLEDHLVVSHKTMKKSEIKEKNGMYVYPITMRRKKRDPDAMDIGNVKDAENEILGMGQDEEDDLF